MDESPGSAAYPRQMYQPLDSHDIRLLKVTHVDGNRRISMQTLPLDRAENEYVALSYTWGDTSNTATISIDGYRIEIRRNLHDFFLEVDRMCKDRNKTREVPEVMTYWIDALCINQEDEGEKALQVGKMGEIYAKAESVLAWLGNANDDTVGMLKCFAVDSIVNEYGAGFQLALRRHIEQDPGNHIALAKLFLRPYFLRAWTTQELVYGHGKKLIVAAGEGRARWQSLAHFSPHHSDLKKWTSLIFDLDAAREDKVMFFIGAIFARLQLIERVSARKKLGKPVTMMSLLLASIHLRATIPKDKIYSLWNLADDGADLLPTLDYNIDDGQVYLDFSLAWIRKYNRLDILSIRACPRDKFVPGCPRWVPDWSDETRLARPFVSHHPHPLRDDTMDEIETERIYAADANIGVSVVAFTSTRIPAMLITAGLSCDTIAYVGPEAPADGEPGEAWADFINDRQEEHDTSIKDACSAMIAGCTPTGERISAPNVAALYGGDDDEEVELGNLLWRRHIHMTIAGRRIASTTAGHVGLVPYWAEPGDEIAVVFGCSVPLLLRNLPGGHGSRMIFGDCYFERMMDGQMVDAAGGPDACTATLKALLAEQPTADAMLSAERQPVHGSTTLDQSVNDRDVTSPPSEPSTSSNMKQNDASAGSVRILLEASVRTRSEQDGVYVQTFRFP